MNTIKSIIISEFRMRGLLLKGEASRFLYDRLSETKNETEVRLKLKAILEFLQSQNLSDSIVERSLCELAFNDTNKQDDDVTDQIFNVSDLFNLPRVYWDHETRRLLLDDGSHEFSDAEVKINIYLDRYYILHQRLLRHPLFTSNPLTESDSKRFQLMTIERLLSSSKSQKASSPGSCVVFGLLSQLREGAWFLEDPTGVLQVDLRGARFQPGLVGEGCFVLAEGALRPAEDSESAAATLGGRGAAMALGLAHITASEHVFAARAVGLPPADTIADSRRFFRNFNWLQVPHVAESTPVSTGAPPAASSALTDSIVAKLERYERDKDEAMIVVVSEIWLDSELVLEKLKRLFDGYSGQPPFCFVLCGNFLEPKSTRSNYSYARLHEGFVQLAKVIQSSESIAKESNFVIVPGPGDLTRGPFHILPRPSFPSFVVEAFMNEFRAFVPHVTFCSNPARFRYCTQDVFVLRAPVVEQLLQNSLCRLRPRLAAQLSEQSGGVEPSEEALNRAVELQLPSYACSCLDHCHLWFFSQVARTVVSSCSASPLPLHVSPVAWRRASALSLYPLPDLIVLAGDFAPPFAAAPPTAAAAAGVAAAGPVDTPGTEQHTRAFPKEYPVVLSPELFLTNMAKSPSALLLLAEGAEEIEVVMPVDFLRRAGVAVTIAGVNGPEAVPLNVQIKFTPDCSLQEVIDKKLQYTLVIVPGGIQGTQTLCESALVKQVLQEQNARKGLIAAICAGPTALKAHGIGVGQNRKVTSHPLARPTMEEGGAYVYSEEHVVVDGNLVTTRGPGTAAQWSILLAEMLTDKAKVDEIAKYLQF